MTAAPPAEPTPPALGPAPRRPLRITIVANEVRSIGGTDMAVRSLAAGLVGRGHDVTIISRSCDLPRGTRARHIRVPGPERPFPLTYLWFVVAGTILARRYRSDIVHVTGAVILGRADVCTVHALHAAAARAWDTRSVARGPLHLLSAAVSQPMKRLGERVCFRPSRIRCMVAVSEGQRRELAVHFPRLAGRTLVIPNGVNAIDPAEKVRSRDTGRARLGIADDDLVAIFVGGEWERKRLKLALQGVLATPRWHLLVVGEGEEQPYRVRAAAAGASHRLHFLGRTPSRPWYATADAFVLPSLYESFSLTPLEAAAMGLPLLVSRVHGLDGLLVDGQNGWLLDDDPGTITQRLVTLEDPTTRHRMGKASRATAAGFSWDHVVEAYEAVYDSLVPRRSSSPPP